MRNRRGEGENVRGCRGVRRCRGVRGCKREGVRGEGKSPIFVTSLMDILYENQ